MNEKIGFYMTVTATPYSFEVFACFSSDVNRGVLVFADNAINNAS